MRRKLIACLMPIVLAMSSVAASAQAIEDEDPIDARLVGYTSGPEGQQQSGPIVIKPPAGAAGTWFIIAILGVVCLGVMCKNAKRTHLD